MVTEEKTSLKSQICGFAVQSPRSLKEDLCFSYQGTEFKYIPNKNPKRSDSLVCKMNGLSFKEVYRKSLELLGALTYTYRAPFILGNSVHSVVERELSIFDMNGMTCDQRKFFVVTQEIFSEIALIKNENQSNLIRLYRQAFCDDNLYARFLFYWHALVYPSETDDCAVKFINRVISGDTTGSTKRDVLEGFVSNPLFSKTGTIDDIGKYLKSGIRHAIAHIVRSGNDVNLRLDDFEEREHLQYACKILEDLVRLRLEQDFCLTIGTEPNIYQVLSQD